MTSWVPLVVLKPGSSRQRQVGGERGNGRAAARPRRRPNPYSASEAGRDGGEGPVALGDAGAVGDDATAGAAPVAVDRPERQPGDVVAVGPVADAGPGRRAGGLLL